METGLYLEHHGIRGMRWGVRRFQNKDGSLTPFGKKHVKETDEPKEETTEERRARVLKSTNAKELYENKDILTTSEINERLNRIDAEVKLARVVASTQKSGMDKVDTVIKYAKKANEIYELTNNPLSLAIRKKLGDAVDTNVKKNLSPDLQKVWANRSKMTDEQFAKVLKRATNERTIKRMMDEYESEKNASKATESSSKKSDNDYGSDKKETSSRESETFKKSTVEGKGTSHFDGFEGGPTVDAKEGRDYWSTNTNTRDTKMSDATGYESSGRSYISGLLEDKKRGD